MTIEKLMGALLVGTLSLSPTLGQAQDTSAGEDVQNFVFGDELVDGDHATPLGEILPSRRVGRHTTLIHPRYNFIPELRNSVEDL